MIWQCQAYRGMDTYRAPVLVEADSFEEAAEAAKRLVPFGDVMQCDLMSEADELRARMADLLTRTANALKGAPKPLCQHSWHDLPEVAKHMAEEVRRLA